jgi:hypothetical protein
MIRTLGLDPEMFLVDKDGKYISAVGLVGGTKERPKQITDLPRGYGVQEDNVAVELTIPPSESKEELIDKISLALEGCMRMIPKGLTLSDKCSAYFDFDQLETEAACAFGCSPEMDAYTGSNFQVKASDAGNFRTCGGHVHIGIDGLDIKRKGSFVIALDLFLGIPSMFLDKDTERRKLYGKAGSFRDKRYGLEYRVLSNFWIFDPGMISWVWDSVKAAYDFFIENEKELEYGYYELPLRIQHVINEKDYEEAEKLLKEFKVNERSNSSVGITWDR